MTLIYISHWRFPSEKTMSPLIMKTCEMFARNGIRVELWVPWRNNRGFSRHNAFVYHDIEKVFIIRRLPAIDFTGVFPGTPFFFLMVATFAISAFLYALWRRLTHDTVFYFHDARDAILFSFLKRPIFLEIHDFYKSRFGALNRFIFPKISGFIVTNRVKEDQLSRDFFIPQNRMLHRPNGVDPDMFDVSITREKARELLALPENKRVIVYTGHLFDWKGADTLLETAKQFQEGNFKFSIFPPEADPPSADNFQYGLSFYLVGGTDKDIARFKKQAEGYKNIVIVGRRPHKEIPLWLRAADVLVLPNTAKFEASKFETSPVKLFEYMSSRTPIVASDLPSIRNIVDERLVFFSKPDDPASFADMIHFVFTHPEDAKERARRARVEVAQYSWERRRDAIVKFLQSRIGL